MQFLLATLFWLSVLAGALIVVASVRQVMMVV